VHETYRLTDAASDLVDGLRLAASDRPEALSRGGNGGDGSNAIDGDPESDAGGTYTLLVELAAPATIEVGALGDRRFEPGIYAYTGSALGTGGSPASTATAGPPAANTTCATGTSTTCSATPTPGSTASFGASTPPTWRSPVADRLPASPVDGFGASDCDCGSHLAAGTDGATALATLVREAHEVAVEETGGHVDVIPGSTERIDDASATR